ncbi:MAG: 1-deoxy-D-xylulose-5-phosphate reductoisomerase, partial [Sphaerochaeta sp.]
MKKKIILLGCTGSIGTTAIQAIRDSKLDVQVVGISAHSNQDSLFNLASELGCNAVCLTGKACPPCTSIRTYSFFSGLSEMLASLEADIVLNAIAGFDGLQASLLSLKHGFDLALANKESVVCAGSFLFDYARENHRSIIPVDSEHSAISELLKKRDPLEVDTLILTGSGGPFRTLPHEQFSSITVEQALNHPTWNMGKKITIDSATLANKALEVIEAS